MGYLLLVVGIRDLNDSFGCSLSVQCWYLPTGRQKWCVPPTGSYLPWMLFGSMVWTFLDISLHCGTTEASFMKNWRTTSTIGRFIRLGACLFCLVFWVEFIFSWRLFGFLDGLNDSVKLSMLDVRNSLIPCSSLFYILDILP